MHLENADLIENEMLRLNIQHHSKFPGWYNSFPPHARQVFDLLIENDATPELIEMAQHSPEEEWHEFEFLRVIGGGNPDPEMILALTNVTLSDIWVYLEFGD